MALENIENFLTFVRVLIFNRSRMHQNNHKSDYSLAMKACFLDYISFLRHHCKDRDITSLTVSYCQKLIEILNTSMRGRQSSAYSKMKAMLDSLCEDGMFCEHDREEYLYRMRVCNLRRDIARQELFHIPFNLIRKVETERYSTPGLPCLYLARSIYCCWEEMHRPSIENTLVSAFRAESNFNLVDMRIPDIDRFKKFETWYMRAFPLIIACSIPVVQESSAFKPEYIIPQFVLQWVIEAGEEHDVIGITYTSTFTTDEFFELDYEWENIVLPVSEISTTAQHCKRLVALFKMSKPTCYEYEVMTGVFANTGVWDNGPKRLERDNPKNDYYCSIFSRMEEELEKRDLDGIYNTL